MEKKNPPKEVILTKENLQHWSEFQKLYKDGKVIFDNTGRLRYPHGAPVGKMILVRMNKNGQAIYKESAEEWFDPDSPAAKAAKAKAEFTVSRRFSLAFHKFPWVSLVFVGFFSGFPICF